MTFLRRKFLHLFAGVAAMPLSHFAQAQVSPTASQTRSSRNRATCDMAKHCLARSRSRCVQKARDRYDPPGHCGRGS